MADKAGPMQGGMSPPGAVEENDERQKKKLEEIENLVDQLGFGRWNLLMIAPIVFWGLLLPYFSLGSAFLNPNVDHWCKEKNITALLEEYPDAQLPHGIESNIIWEEIEGTKVKSSCEEYDIEGWLRESHRDSDLRDTNQTTIGTKKCEAWQYDTSVFSSTVASEWDLVCDSAGLSPFFQTLYYFGVTVGEPLTGYLSDRFGRRWIIRRLFVVFLIASVTSVNSSSYALLLATRFFLGMSHASACTSYVIETCPRKYRSAAILVPVVTFSMSGMIFGGLAYFIRDWRFLQTVCIAPALFHLFYLPFLDESPRWLIMNGKPKEGVAILKKVARWHNVELRLPDFLTREISSQDSHALPVSAPPIKFVQSIRKKLEDLLILVRTPALRKVSLAMFGCWFAIGLAYWGISLSGGSFSTDPFLYMVIQSIIEAVGYVYPLFLFRCMGRRLSVAGNFFGCAAAMLLTLVVPKGRMWVIFTLAMIGKFFISAVYNTVYLYSVELFPTCARSRGLNMSSTMARLASIFSPFIVTVLANAASWAPSVVFGTATALGTIFALVLPETKGRPLLDSVEQAEIFYAKKKKTDSRDFG